MNLAQKISQFLRWAIFAFYGLISLGLGLIAEVLTKRHHQRGSSFKTTPTSMRGHVFSKKDNPQVVSYGANSLNPDVVASFAKGLCISETVRIEPAKPFFQRLRGRSRVQIFC